MFKIFVLLVVLICVVSAIPTATDHHVSYDGYKVFLVRPKTESQFIELNKLDGLAGVDIWDTIHKSNSVCRVMVAPKSVAGFENILNHLEIGYSRLIENVESILENERNAKKISQSRRKSSAKAFEFEHFWEIDEINAYLDYISADFSDFVKVETLGKSSEGRDIRVVKISLNGDVNDVNPIVLIDGTVHSREWIGTMVTLNIIHQLVENKDNNMDILTGLDWVIVPVVNIDGYVHSHNVDRFWRKTRSLNPENPDCIGTDPNRNFNFQWDFPGGSSTNPCSNSYRGSAPFSEIEIKLMGDLMRQYTQTKLYLSIHSYGKYLLYPYGYNFIRVENYQDHIDVGKLARYAIYERHGTYFELGNSAEILYIASGASDDYAIGGANIPMAFTVELPGGGTGGFDIEPERIQEVLIETYPGIREFGKYILLKFGVNQPEP